MIIPALRLFVPMESTRAKRPAIRWMAVDTRWAKGRLAVVVGSGLDEWMGGEKVVFKVEGPGSDAVLFRV